MKIPSTIRSCIPLFFQSGMPPISRGSGMELRAIFVNESDNPPIKIKIPTLFSARSGYLDNEIVVAITGPKTVAIFITEVSKA